MAKSLKKASKKVAKKVAKKVVKKAAKKGPKKAVKKAPIKMAKKAAKKVAKKAVRIAPKKAVKKAAKKTVKKAVKKATRKAASPAPTSVQTSGKRFLIVYHAPAEAMAQTANVTPEQQAAGMELWRAWAERAGSKLVDLGAPLINGKRLTAEGAEAPSSKEVSGYSVLQAEDWEELMELLTGHPHLSGWHPDASIEVHETMVIPGM